MIVAGGDILHRKDLPTDVIKQFERFMLRMFERFSDWQMIVIGGNHEWTPEGNSVLELVNWPANVSLVTQKPLVVGDDYFVPFTPELKSILQKLPSNIRCFTHCMVDGSRARTRLTNADFKPDLFKRFKITMLGDIHRRQAILTTTGRRIYYSGCFVQTSMNDYGYTPGFTVIDGVNVSYRNLKVPLLEPASQEELDIKDQKEISKRIAQVLNAEVPVTASMSLDDVRQVVRNAMREYFSDKALDWYLSKLTGTQL